MKNRLKVIVLWAIVALIVQFSGLFYANNYLLSNNINDVKMEKIDVNKNENDKPQADVSLPDDLNMFKSSYNGKYISYIENKEIKIINTENGNVQKTGFTEGSYYQWINDRNRILIGLKKGSEVELSYYDIDKDVKEKIKDIEVDGNGKVTDIKAATLTQVTYMKVTNGSKNYIYRLNIMNELTKIKIKTSKIGEISVCKREDKLLYEDLTSNKIDISDSDTTLKAAEGINKLLSVDIDDNVYIANVDKAGIVKTLVCGSVKNGKSFKKLEVPADTNYKNIYVTNNGNVYANENLKGILRDVKNNKDVSYQGRILSIYEGGITSVSGGKLVKTKIQP